MRDGTTAARGYGSQHRRDTHRLKAEMVDGQPCARGGEPLYRWQLDLPRHDPRSVDGDHIEQPLGLGGYRTRVALSCAHHNRSHGASLGNRMRGLGMRAERPVKGRRAEVNPTSKDW